MVAGLFEAPIDLTSNAEACLKAARKPTVTCSLLQTTFNLNFSMNAAPIACQYYNFIRLG